MMNSLYPIVMAIIILKAREEYLNCGVRMVGFESVVDVAS